MMKKRRDLVLFILFFFNDFRSDLFENFLG